MAQIAIAYEGRMGLINEVLGAIFGKPDEKAQKKADLDLGDKTTLVSVKNSSATMAIMQSLKAKAAAVFSKPAPADAPSSIFSPPAES
jgi:hypothetical protein